MFTARRSSGGWSESSRKMTGEKNTKKKKKRKRGRGLQKGVECALTGLGTWCSSKVGKRRSVRRKKEISQEINNKYE